MKKKILIASILLSLTTIVLVCSFVGCQERPATTLQQPADESSERPTIADDSEKPDSEPIVRAQTPAELSKLQPDASEDESGLRIQQVVVESLQVRLWGTMLDFPCLSGRFYMPTSNIDDNNLY